MLDWFDENVEPILLVIGREIRGRSVEVRGKAVCFLVGKPKMWPADDYFLVKFSDTGEPLGYRICPGDTTLHPMRFFEGELKAKLQRFLYGPR